MQQAKLLFEYSPWFIILCLATGALYAFILYQKDGPWGKKINYTLAALRFLLASILAFLLIGPFLRQINNTVEKPSYVFAIDNSASVKAMADSTGLQQIMREISQIKSELESRDYATELRSLSITQANRSGQDLIFDHPSTDLDGLLKGIQADYEGRSLAGVILLSDGIYNQGVSPTFSPYKFPVYSIGVGDTIPKADININAIYYNKIAYQGNKFPVLAEIASNGLSGEKIEVKITQKGKTLASETVTLKSDNTLDEVELYVEAESNGLQHYQVIVSETGGEFTTKNNRRDAYVDIIEGKEKVLLVARAPHPDIKVIRNAITKNDNYEFVIHIPGFNTFKKDKYDLVIFHQIPDISNTAQRLMEDFLAEGVATWFIIGGQSNLDYFNRVNGVLEIEASGWQTDRVTPSFNPDFQRFIYDESYRSELNDFSPVLVPYGEVVVKPDAQVVLYQKVGSIVTKKPLLAIRNEDDKKMGVLVGEGFWQWRLQEFANNENHTSFDDLISKTVQYLSSKEDKRKFKVYPINNEIYDTESAVFETEIYNNIYERVYNQEIDLTITGENDFRQKYTYNISQGNSRYTVTGLEQGIYKYVATTKLDGQNESSAGEFTVRALQIEDLNLTANHQLLRALSIQNAGGFYYPEELNALADELTNQKVQGIIRSSEAYLPIINLPWVFFLLITLVSIEWFTRKYNGGY